MRKGLNVALHRSKFSIKGLCDDVEAMVKVELVNLCIGCQHSNSFLVFQMGDSGKECIRAVWYVGLCDDSGHYWLHFHLDLLPIMDAYLYYHSFRRLP